MGRIARTDRIDGAAKVRVTVLVVIVGLLAALAGPPAAAGQAKSTWLVPAADGVPPGAELVASVPVADALVVRGDAPADAVTLDTELSWQTAEVGEPAGEADATVDEVIEPTVDTSFESVDDPDGADGALIALIDTGVAPVNDLQDAVAAEIDFSGAGGGDGHGHGTFMASLIAARGELVSGTAPAAGIVSLKVADSEGTTTLGQVLGAMQWLEGPGRSLGIRIASLSLGVDADSPAGHLLDMAVDHLAASGVLVVAAAGNDGPGTLTSPATAPGSFSVGAHDADGMRAAFSADGKDRAGDDKPVTHAPGVDMEGHLAPGSVIAKALEGTLDDASDDGAGLRERLANGLLRGSGTSAAAAVASGIAANVSAAYPDLDGAGLAEALAAGDGNLDQQAALDAAKDIEPLRPTEGAPRQHPGNAPDHANAPDSKGQGKGQGNGQANGLGNGPADLESIPLPSVARWSSAQWEGDGWTGADWAVARWHVARWHEQSWSVARWHVARWHVARWHADDWSAATWDASHWDVARWHADGWNVARWHVARWHVARWHADDWNVARWHVARWHADDWNVARWHVARWHADDWNVARWHGDDWNVARWHGGGMLTPDK